MSARPTKTLVLHIAVPGIWADDLDEHARYMSEPAEPGPGDRLEVVLNGWMREEVGLTIVSVPDEKSMNHEFTIHAYDALVVGAELRERASDDE